MKKQTVTVKQDEKEPMPTEILAESIKSISDGIKRLRSGRMNDRCLVILIHDACDAVGIRYAKKKPSAKEIKAVLNAMESLESQFLKKPQ